MSYPAKDHNQIILRILVEQQTAHFKIPTCGKVLLSYPLPPPSVIYGFLRKISGMDKEFGKISNKTLALSISGKWNAKRFDYQRMHRPQSPKDGPEILNVEKLFNAQFKIYLKAESELIKRIEESLTSPSCILKIGRSDDVVTGFDYYRANILAKNLREIDSAMREKIKIANEGYYFWIPNDEAKKRKIQGMPYKVTIDSIVYSEKERFKNGVRKMDVRNLKYAQMDYTPSLFIAPINADADSGDLVWWI